MNVINNKNQIIENFKNINDKLIKFLEESINDEMILNSFIRDIEIIFNQNEVTVIATKTQEAFDIINNNYVEKIEIAVKKILGKNNKVVLTISKDNIEVDNKVVLLKKTPKMSKIYRFDNYVKAKFNEEVIKISKKIIKKPGLYSPFFITSKSGLGKTHLLNAIGNKLIEENILCHYVEPDLLTNKIVKYAKNNNKSISTFVKELNQYQVLLFDDIQNLGDRSITLRVLLQILNSFHNNEKQIIIASDKIPRELSGFEPRFITRFSSGITSIITQPSNEDLIKILKFKLGENKLLNKKWDPEAIKFIVRNYSQSIRSIEGAIKKISYYIEESMIPKYTYAVIYNIFKDDKLGSFELNPRRIINIVTEYYNVSKSDIKGRKRNARIVTARHMAIWMIRKLLIIPLKEIGYIFGNRDHSTIMSSIKTVDRKISVNEVMRMAAEKIENKIKKVS